jgi:hypothetical protein
VDVRASKRATRHIRKHGGVLYVWADRSGMLRHATARPPDREFRRLRGPGFGVFLQKGLTLGEWVGVERSPFPPWRLLLAFDLMGVSGGDGGSGGP